MEQADKLTGPFGGVRVFAAALVGDGFRQSAGDG